MASSSIRKWARELRKKHEKTGHEWGSMKIMMHGQPKFEEEMMIGCICGAFAWVDAKEVQER